VDCHNNLANRWLDRVGFSLHRDTKRSSVSWVNFYLDNNWLASSPPYTRAGIRGLFPTDCIRFRLRLFNSSGIMIGTASVSVNVQNGVPTTTPTPAPSSTPTPTSSPTPTPTGAAFYIGLQPGGLNGASAPSTGSACAMADAGTGYLIELAKVHIRFGFRLQSSAETRQPGTIQARRYLERRVDDYEFTG